MSLFRLILASLVTYRRSHLAVALGVAVGTAVLTGALLVGDSMRGSLRDLTLERLGRIDEVLLAPRFFRVKLAEELSGELEFPQYITAVVPAILLQATVENPDSARPARAGQVNLIGCDASFWDLFPGVPRALPEDRQIVLNQPLAEQLGARVGDSVMVRLPRLASIPADSSLGRKKDIVQSYRLTVSQIIPARGPGRFDLRVSQQLPANAIVPLDWLAQRLEQPDQANILLVAGRDEGTAAPKEAEERLQRSLRPSLADYGLRVEETRQGYINITSERMLLELSAEEAIRRALAGHSVQPVLTYLANTIACGERQIPYSTIAAVDLTTTPPLGPLLTPEGKPIEPLRDGQIVLNSWAAQELQAKPGDQIQVTYFEPESTDGDPREKTTTFQLVAIAELAGRAADPAFTPEVPGVTDQKAIADWDPPFPFDAKRIRKQDEQYWDAHRATPKAFVSLAAGQRLWGSRFGQTTSLRVVPGPRDKQTGQLHEAEIQDIVSRAPLPAELGFLFQPVKRQGLAASAGTTPFGVLFLAFSFFIILAAAMLVALLFRLSVEVRASQVGILLATGWSRRRIGRLFGLEGLAVAAIGAVVGTAAGAGYAALMLAGLQTWWLAAIVTPFLRLHVTAQSLVIGCLSGLTVALVAIGWAVRHIARTPPRQLLTGVIGDTSNSSRSSWQARKSGKIAVGLFLVAMGMSLGGLRASEELRAGVFFGVGALTLGASLTAIWFVLRAGATGPAVKHGRGSLVRLAMRNAARNPGRSTLTIGAIASAAFLIVSVSAFRLDPALKGPSFTSGNGGFSLVAQTDQPIYYDLNSPEGRAELGFSAEDSKLLSDTKAFAFRVRPGEDASCLNLYRPRQPRVLGVPARFCERGGFAFSDYRRVDAGMASPWQLLSVEALQKTDSDGVPRVPAILDEATAKYSLHLWKGVGQTLEITDGRGQPLHLEVVGLLKNSIFQDDVLIHEEALRRFFPEVAGYRYFLVESPPVKQSGAKNVLQRVLGDYGFVAETTGERLTRLLAVQNTYLSTFQTLGSLGLLLGTFGLAAVQLRNVMERRRELALLRAVGFRAQMLAWLVMVENGLVLFAGLGCGVVAAAVAVLPHALAGAAMLPWGFLAATLLLVLCVGLLAGLAAVRVALTSPVLGALCEE